jgi:hypothetical protein
VNGNPYKGYAMSYTMYWLIEKEHRKSRRKEGKNDNGHFLPACLLVFFVSLILGGCSSLRITDPARTATEQYLLSQAATEAVRPFSFEVLRGRKVWVDDSFFAAAQKEFVLGELRAKLLLSGVQISTKREECEIVLEVRSGGVGIDRYESLIGIPSIGASPTGAPTATGASSMPTIVTPEIAITKEIRQIGFASVAYVAYWADTGEVVDSYGPSEGKAYRDDWWLFGFGPRTIGTIPPVNHHLE